MNKWLEYPLLDKDLKEELLKMNDEELADAFYTDISFGTGGMRGIIGPGTNRMNIYTLRKANYGFGKFILNHSEKNPSVVIAYDSRNKSLEFAKNSATVLTKMGIKVYLFKKITPTPELSFAIRHLKANGGIVITASHNPANYNGYKIYDNKGCQLVPDLVDEVIDYINNSPDMFNIEVDDFEEALDLKKIVYVDNDIDTVYLEKVKTVGVHNNLDKDLTIVFTPLHGTSAYLGNRLLTELGYNVVCVKEQMVADSAFSTVVLPNPEDKKAFDLAIDYAKKYNADLIVATDPDADRLGIAVLDNNEYRFLTGNQTGAILVYYLCNYRLFDGILFNTIVTSDLGAKIADYYGVPTISTLTGFKYIGEQAGIYENTNKKFFFGYEESYGYVIKDFVRDKDSLQAMAIISEVVQFYKNKNKTLIDVLNEIYQKFNYYKDDLMNISLTGEAGTKKIERILDFFRNNELDTFDIYCKEDYLLHKRYVNNKVETLTLPTSNVLKYILKDGSWFVLRPSGTEPKMKVYICTSSKVEQDAINKVKEIKEKVMKYIDEVE